MQVKSKLLKQYHLLNYIVSSGKFKLIFFLTIVLCFYGTISITSLEDTYIDTALISFRFYIFNLFTFLILFLNTLNTCVIFNKEFSNYIIRLKSKKKYVNEMLKTTFLLNVFFFILLFILYFILLSMFKLSNIQITPFQNYDISNLIYLLFYLFRYTIYGLLIMMMTTIIYINFKEKITLITSSIFLLGFLEVKFAATIGNSLILKPWTYFSSVMYSSFFSEVKFSLLYLLLLIFIVVILYVITLKNKRWEIT